ncbi:MAG: M48 family metallopeptidase [Steroidobacteraceae bacterium]|nr:M48 family metallopeptidase [Steroidobacteraceae bacterium]
MQFDALVFGPGLPAGGARGSLAVDGVHVHVRADGAAGSAPLSAVELREVGFGRPGIECAWAAGTERWAVHVLDPQAAARLLTVPAVAASPQATVLQSRRRRRNVGRTLGWSVVALLVLLPVILLLLIVLQADRLAGWATRHVPVEAEVRLGRAAFDTLRADLDLQVSGPAYEAVQALGGRLAAGSRYRYEFHVARDATVNAFALPGGIIVVHTGLIEATRRAEELAGVLAHEIEHVEQRHALEGVVKNLGLRAAWALATGDLGGTLAGEAALRLTGLQFSRDAEAEADAGAFARLVERGIDPSGLRTFFVTLGERVGPEPPALLSTHPASAERARVLAGKLAPLGGRRFEPLPYPNWPPQ